MRRWLPLVVVAAGVASSSPARAQAILHDQRTGDIRSPQSWAVELRFGPYSPDIDAEFKGAASPHRAYFGTKKRLMFQIEGEYQFFHRFGSLAVGVSAGYFHESGRSFLDADPTTLSDDVTALSLFPTTAKLIYRFDVVQRRYGIPLVPFGKVGLSYTLWSISNGNGKTATSDKPEGKGRGGTPGWLAGVGLAFNLGVLDPSAARSLDNESGVNDTYLFIEYDHLDSSGLGRKNTLNVGDDTWVGGLLFEF